jgi:D-Tyr-tRNAtyr deacylase
MRDLFEAVEPCIDVRPILRSLCVRVYVLYAENKRSTRPSFSESSQKER